MTFDPEWVRQIRSSVCQEHGTELTPGQVETHFREQIRSYREAARGGGRLDIADGWSDEQVFARIQELWTADEIVITQ